MPVGNAFSSFRRSVLVTFSSDPPPTDRTKPPLSVFTMNGNGLSPGVSTTMRILPSWEETFTPLTCGVSTGISEATVPWATPQMSTTIRNGSLVLKEL